MAGLTTKKVAKKVKKHGKKAGQKSLIRPSQKKSVKNGRHQEVDGPKKTVQPVKNVKKAVKSIPPTLDGPVESDELDEFLQEPEFDYAEEDTNEPEFFNDLEEEETYDENDVSYPDKEY